MEITKDKEYTTRVDNEVRIYEVYKEQGEVHGAWQGTNGNWIPCRWLIDGSFNIGAKDRLDLIEKPKTKKVYIDVYIDPMSKRLVAEVFDSKQELEDSYIGAENTKQLEVIEREYPIK